MADQETRLGKQIQFLLEVDRLKQVLRNTYLLDNSRRENDAEHSWHVSLLAMLLHEYASEPVDLLRTLKMLLVHDVVEIDVGDVFIYDAEGQARKPALERVAAQRIFGMLPQEQGEELLALWEEFEARETPEARFARALDRLQPLLHNYHTQGRAWNEHGIGADRVLSVNQPILADGAPKLEEYAVRVIQEAVEKGYLRSGS
jgi:putative hydrolase of HD superfamily